MPDDETIPPPIDINVPPPDYLQAGKLEAQGTKESGLPERLAAGIVLAVVRFLAPAVRILAGSLDEILAAVAVLFQAGQGEGSRGFSDLVAAVLGDLLGVEIAGDSIFAAFQTRGRIAAMQEAGSGLLDLLTKEFISGGDVSPEQGDAAVRAFLGFVLSFAVRQGNIEFLTSLIPEEYRFADGFRAYGELMAKNLGLGRLTRVALRPLMTTLVATPFQWRLNQSFHPTQFREGDMISPLQQTLMSSDLIFQQMDLLGYSKDKIEALIKLHQKRLTVDEIDLFYRFGSAGRDDAIAHLADLGYPPDLAAQVLNAKDLGRGVTALRNLIDSAETAVTDGHITVDDFSALLDTLPIGPLEKAFRLQAVGFKVKAPHTHLTLAQAQKAFEEGIWTLDQLSAYLDARGYSADDSTTLQLITLLALAKLDEAKKVAQFTYEQKVAKAKAKNQAIPPPPAILSS